MHLLHSFQSPLGEAGCQWAAAFRLSGGQGALRGRCRSAVSQQIDTGDEQADLLLTVHGLVDSLYVKELAKKTHRGLEGKVLRGFHAGGRCYGYKNVETAEGVRLEVDESEAAVVRRIFELSAKGCSLKAITRTLNEEAIAAPRPRKGRAPAGWCPTAIREMLRRDPYRGVLVWNRSRFVKVPGTNRRVSRPRPSDEWRTFEAPHLRIVSPELWDSVQRRLVWAEKTYGCGRPRGLFSRSASSPYLLSGLLFCAECGGKLRIVSGSGKGRRMPWYGCPRHFNRGTCPNGLTERRDRLEARLLNGLQKAVLRPEVVDYTLAQFENELAVRLRETADGLEALRSRKAELERQIANYTRALEDGYSAAITAAIAEREREHASISEQILGSEPTSVHSTLTDLRHWVHQRLSDLRQLLYAEVPRARSELMRHVSTIILEPKERSGKRFYVAAGNWNLLANELGPPDEAAPVSFRMVAGAGFEPATFGL